MTQAAQWGLNSKSCDLPPHMLSSGPYLFCEGLYITSYVPLNPLRYLLLLLPIYQLKSKIPRFKEVTDWPKVYRLPKSHPWLVQILVPLCVWGVGGWDLEDLASNVFLG